MNSQDQPTLPASSVVLNKAEAARFVHTDKIVGMLGEFPELAKAVREGDLARVTVLCAQLFDLNSYANHPPSVRGNPVGPVLVRPASAFSSAAH